MSKHTRRAVLAGIAAAPALAAPALAAHAGNDVRLRELWAQYLEKFAAERAIDAAIVPTRAAYDAEEVGGAAANHLSEANQPLWIKHGLDRLYEDWNAAGELVEEIVEAILEEEAEGLFGIGVKLAALPADGNCRDPAHDHEDAIISALTEIDRLIGSTFVSSFKVLHMDEVDDGAVS
jgi:hypothetical protein